METELNNKQLETHFRRWLQTELTNRCKRNPKYSLRAFALLVNMDPSSVSQLLSGKRKASKKVINRLCDALSAHPKQRAAFLKNCANSSNPQKREGLDHAQLLAQDAFLVISEWYNFAILELTYVENFESKPSWIARALGITVNEVHIAIERLKRLQLLHEEDGRLIRTNGLLTNYTPGITSAAHKNLQRQIINMALDAVDNCTQETKDITSITMAIDPSKLEEAKAMIKKFRRDMSHFLQEGIQTRVYNLAIQLYPISKDKKI